MLVLLLWHTFRVSRLLARLFHWALPFLLYPIYLNFSKIPISNKWTPEHLDRKVAPSVSIGWWVSRTFWNLQCNQRWNFQRGFSQLLLTSGQFPEWHHFARTGSSGRCSQQSVSFPPYKSFYIPWFSVEGFSFCLQCPSQLGCNFRVAMWKNK